MALLNVLMAFNLINGGYGLIIAAAAFVISFVFIVLLASKKEVVYIDPDTDYEIAHDKIGWGKKVTLASVTKEGRRFVGWSFDEDGEKRLGKKEIRLWKTTELYAVWEKPMVGVSVDEANAVVEFVYLDADGKEVSKQVCPFAFNVPSELNGKAVAGWALDPEDEPVVTPSEDDKSVLTVELYPIGEGWEKKAVVKEEVIEEPAAEEVIEEVVEEVVEEAPADYAAAVEEAPAEEEPAAVAEAAPVEPVIVPTYIDGNGNELDIRYSRSFMANVIQGEDNVKEFYSELKNHLLSYKGVKSRISWKFDSYNRGRDQLVKLKIRGKTICMYIALDPNEFDKAKYHHDAMDSKIFEDVPMLVKIKSGLGLRKAKELVDILMAKLEIAVDEKAKTVDYVAENPYEETDALVQKGLIKILQADASDVKRAPAIAEATEEVVAEEVVAEEVVAEEVVAEEVVEEVAEEVAPVQPVIVPTYIDGNGNELDIKYSRSFKANVIQADDTVKEYYSELRNHILSYKGVKGRTSWKFDSFNKGRVQLVKLKLRGKTLSMYLALDPNEFDKAKYHHDETDSKMFEDVPMLVKVKSGLGLRKAKELVDILMAKFEIATDAKFSAVDYVAENPYEETDALIQKGLIKILQADENDVKKAPAIVEEVVEEAPAAEVAEEVVAEEVAEEVAAEEVIEEVVAEEVVEEVVEEAAEEVVEEAAEETVEEVTEYVAEEVIEEVAEEVAEEVVEEAPAEEVAEEEVIEEAQEEAAEEIVEEAAEEEAEEVAQEVAPATTVEEIQYVESVSADEVDDLVEDDVVDSLVEDDVEYVSADDTKKAVVNLDTLSKEFEDGDTVDLAALKAKGLVDKKTKSVKILARGTIDKALTVKASEFSETALKMIVLTGGTAVKTTSKVK